MSMLSIINKPLYPVFSIFQLPVVKRHHDKHAGLLHHQ
tara:strand:- start:1199 stop:1312 length:114 start_codon:yes stop_codon:yes gene_type:complete